MGLKIIPSAVGRLGGAGGLSVVGGGEIVYTLRDQFSADLDAGDINGTAATPGPGTRVVTDSGSKMVISNGMLYTLAGSGWGNPGYWLDGVTRAAGVMLIGSIIPADGVGSMMIGWSTAQSSYPAEHAFNLATITLSASVSGSTKLAIGNYLGTGTRYQFAICLRAAGAFYFHKMSGTWQLFYIEPGSKTTGTLYPAVVTNNRIFYADDVYVPKDKFLPVPLMSDSFNRDNGALGSSDGAGHAELNGGSGLAWSDRIGTCAIATNKAICSATAGGFAIATTTLAYPDVYATAKITKGTTGSGVVVRYTDADNYVYAYHDGTNAHLVKHLAAGDTILINAAATYAAGAELHLICSGTSFFLVYNGTQVGSVVVIADATLQSGTQAGLWFGDTDSTVDNCVVWNRGVNLGY